MRRSLVAVCTALVLVLSGCSSSPTQPDPRITDKAGLVTQNQAVLKGVSADVTGNEAKVDAKWPLRFTNISVRLLTDGTGAALKAGDGVYYDSATFSAQDGKQANSSLGRNGGNFMHLDEKILSPEFLALALKSKVGATFLVGSPAQSAQSPSTVAVLRIVKETPTSKATEVPVAEAPKFVVPASGVPTYAANSAVAPTKSTFSVLTKGTGPTIGASDVVMGNLYGWEWKSARAIFTPATGVGPSGSRIDLANGGLYPCVKDALVGQQIGAVVAVSCAPNDGAGDPMPDPAVDESQQPAAGAIVGYIQVTKATKAVAVDAAKLPALSLSGKVPTLAKPTGTPLTETSVAVLKPGTGATLEAGKQATVNYSGWKFSDGSQFDSSFGREPFTFANGKQQVIGCWDMATLGQKAGAELLVSCAPDDAYGANPKPGYPAGALIFYIKLEKVA